MKVIVVQKPTVTSLQPSGYGNEYSTEVSVLENVTNIAETQQAGVGKLYSITHKTAGDADYHVTSFSQEDYVISVM